MRRLAAGLDVTTGTICWHVPSRGTLITEIIRTSTTRLADRAITGATPEPGHRRCRHIWDSALENRAITSLAHRPAPPLLEHRLELALVHEIEAAGLKGDAAALALRSILSTVGGFLVGALRVNRRRRQNSTRRTLEHHDGDISDETIGLCHSRPTTGRLHHHLGAVRRPHPA